MTVAVIWLLPILERFEVLAAAAGQLDLAGAICRMASAFGVIGPCLP